MQGGWGVGDGGGEGWGRRGGGSPECSSGNRNPDHKWFFPPGVSKNIY
jgi:hypothetical protein